MNLLMRPLTDKMLAVLKELAKPRVTAMYMHGGRHGDYYFLSSTMKQCTAQINGIVNRGLAEVFNAKQFGGHEIRITKAGREFLKQTGAIQ